MCYKLYKYLTETNLLYSKQFEFQKWHSPEQLVEQINQSFEKNEFRLGVFIDLFKAFDTVEHQTLLKKLEYYGIAGNDLRWFKNYLKDQNQFISINLNQNQFNLNKFACSVLQGSILGPLIVLIICK